MSIIQSNSVVTKTTTACLKIDDLKKLIAADLGGIDPKSVSLKFELSYNYSDWDSGSISGAEFSSLKVEVVE